MLNGFNDRVFHFKGSVLGFDQFDDFKFFAAEENPSFGYLESVEDPSVGFVAVSPFHFFSGYQFEIEEKVKDELKLVKPEEVLVLSIIHVKNPFTESTVNLMAPLIINVTNNQGRQMILTQPSMYGTKEKLLVPSSKEGGEDAC
ncbi:flagellar assembly protein FliW [Cohnella zeiphila]|uniref:Flagellar assembly factor FliW n=1 Tax=Cohnella zeiphila TaxID=2761120 RepID=A0A7X0SLL6_9BACL|nr:flagellar assembly protein FliW [Cohnella zeiphila]MBB6732257.1 flagellar assembly protein FliW [Cohnella zeiphila]